MARHPGDDIYFALGYLAPATARSYLSRLKVWATAKGYKQIRIDGK